MIQIQTLNNVPSMNIYGQYSMTDGYNFKNINQKGVYGYWDHMDYIIRTAAKKGLYIGMVCIWGSPVSHGEMNVDQAKAYGKFLAERYKDEIMTEIEEVDAVIGTTSYQHIAEVVAEVLEGQKVKQFDDLQAMPEVDVQRIMTTGGYSSYLKIAEGCDKHCTYCIIPKVRGDFRSVPMEHLLEEAQNLADGGVKELILVAQETTMYGTDLYGEKRLPQLLRALCKISGLRWIRILYCYPEEITDELIQVIKEEPKICHYLDLPIQHASDGILKRMGRRTSRAQLIETIEKLRREIPDIALRTTLITGFPGETQEQHEELMDFVDQMEFDRLGVFTYSPEEDTPAASMPDQIPEEVKEERQAELMELQQDIVFDQAEDRIGEELLVMIEAR